MAETEQDPRAAARAMLEQLRASEPEPYREGRPVPRVISVAGRRSGEPRPFGVNVTQVGGALYACSSTRTRDWVRNLLAAGECRVERDGPNGTDTPRRPVLVEGHEAAQALSVYLTASGYHDPDLPFDPSAPVDEIKRHTTHVAVLRLDPAPQG